MRRTAQPAETTAYEHDHDMFYTALATIFFLAVALISNVAIVANAEGTAPAPTAQHSE